MPTPVRRRPYELLRALRKRGHDLTLLCPWERPEEREVQRELASLGVEIRTHRIRRSRRAANLAWAAVRGWPLQAAYDRLPALHAELERLLSQPDAFDVAHVEHLRGAQYALQIGERLPVIWDSVDCISRLLEQARARAVDRRTRVVASLELPRTRRFERRALQSVGHVSVTSGRDAAALQELAGREDPASAAQPDIMVVPNGVDLEAFHPPVKSDREPATVLMTGKMSYHANVAGAHHLVETVMPLVWSAEPSARVVLAGATPVDSVRALARRHPDRVHVTGGLRDLRPILLEATVAVAFLPYGVGIQNKVLEAMACATPVIASADVVDELEVRCGEELFVADDAEQTAHRILQLLRDPDRAERIGRAGRRYVEQHHRWSDVAARLESLYERALRSGAGSAA